MNALTCRSPMRMPLRSILLEYAGPMPFLVVPILLRPKWPSFRPVTTMHINAMALTGVHASVPCMY
jgi:hypothetical protein